MSSFNRDLFGRDPFNRDPFSSDPLSRNMFSRDPFNRDPFNMDLLGRDLFSMNPFSNDPFFQEFNTGSRLINKHRHTLSKWLSEDDSMFKNIQDRKLLTIDDHYKLDSIQNPSERSKTLLDLIQNKGSGVCDDFLTLLKEDMKNSFKEGNRQLTTTVETFSCSSDVNGGRPEIKKWVFTADNTPGSPGSPGSPGTPGSPVKGTPLNGFKAIQYAPSAPPYANVSSNPTQIASQTTKDVKTNVSSNLPQGDNQTSKDTNVSSNLSQGGNQTSQDTNVSSNPTEDDSALIKDNMEFLKKNRTHLTQKVKNIGEITDALENLSEEQRTKINAVETDQDKMRLILNYTNSKTAAKNLINALLEHAKDVMDDLIAAQKDTK